MSVREGNQLLVVNNLMKLFWGGEEGGPAAEKVAALFEQCRAADLGDAKSAVHFRLRSGDKSVRMEIKDADRMECVIERTVALLLRSLGLAAMSDDDIRSRLAADVFPHVRAYVGHRRGVVEQAGSDADVRDTVMWLAAQLQPKIDRATVDALLRRMRNPARKYAMPRTEADFEQLETVYRAAAEQFKRQKTQE